MKMIGMPFTSQSDKGHTYHSLSDVFLIYLFPFRFPQESCASHDDEGASHPAVGRKDFVPEEVSYDNMEENSGVLHEAHQDGRGVEAPPGECHLRQNGTEGHGDKEGPFHILRNGKIIHHKGAATEDAVHLEVENNFCPTVPSSFVQFSDTGIGAAGEEGAGQGR